MNARAMVKKSDAKSGNSSSRQRRAAPTLNSNTPTGYVLHLQRTLGNRAVQRLFESGLIQAKLKIGRPGDIYEKEADRVADAVMHMPEPHVRRQPEEKEEEPVQPKPLAEQITPLVQRQVEEEEPIQTKLLSPDNPVAQRLEEEEEKETLQSKEINGQAPAKVTPHIESSIHALKGRGQPLPKSVRTFFEPRFGRDFGQVRLHTDGRAAETARAVNARAFTMGPNIVFGAGQYAPGTIQGKRLLAHELTHTVQQGTTHTFRVNPQYSSFSAKARQVAMDGRATHLSPQTSVIAPQIQRRVEILNDPLPPGFVGPPARTGADFIEGALEDFTDLNLSFRGTLLEVDAATRAAVLRERRERPTPADVRARLFIIPGVSRANASAALKLAQIIIDTRATARIQPVFGEAGVLVGAFPAAGGGGIQRIDIEDLRAWESLTHPSIEPFLRIMAWLRRFSGLAAAARPATPIRTFTIGSQIYHEIVESFRADLAGAGTPFPEPHRAAITTANVALRAMSNLEFLPCPSLASPSAGGEIRVRTLWRRRRGAGREDRFAQNWFFSAPPVQALVWVDPPILIHANVRTGDPCPP